jgi:hypothetical protein
MRAAAQTRPRAGPVRGRASGRARHGRLPFHMGRRDRSAPGFMPKNLEGLRDEIEHRRVVDCSPGVDTELSAPIAPSRRSARRHRSRHTRLGGARVAWPARPMQSPDVRRRTGGRARPVPPPRASRRPPRRRRTACLRRHRAGADPDAVRAPRDSGRRETPDRHAATRHRQPGSAPRRSGVRTAIHDGPATRPS